MTRLLSTLFLFCALIGPALAQSAAPAATPAPPSATQNLQTAQAGLKTVAHALASPDLSDSQLQALRDQLDPVAAAAQSVVQDLTPRLDAAKARLTQLGPAPAATAPPEAANLKADRAHQLQIQTALNSELTQAKLILVDVDQLGGRISSRRRDSFVNAVFAQSYSLVSPSLWSQVAVEAPQDVGAVLSAWEHWSAAAVVRLDGWTWVAFFGALAAIALFYVGCAALVRRILAREPGTAEPSRLAKALAAVWVAFLTALAPSLGVTAVVLALRAFGLADPAADPFLRALVGAVIRIAVAAAIARGLLAAGRPQWRLLDLSTPTCERLLRLVVVVAIVISLGKAIGALADQIGVSLPMSVAVRGVAALAVAVAMAMSLRGILPDQDESEDCLGPRVSGSMDWYAPVRFAVWAVILALIVAALSGYVAFASFLVDQLVWIAFVGAALYLVLALANEGVAAAFRPNAAIGRALIRSLGLRRDSLQQFAIIASGAATLALCVIAALLALAPWGIQSADMLGGLRAAFFGFQVGELKISLSALVIAAALFALGLIATRWIQRWFDTQLLPATHLDVGLRNSIRTSLGYLGVIAASALALAHLGVDFQKIAIVAGALSVGIGFGLQSIVNNFVSGLIILWERAIRVGDLVVIGDDQGHVRRINVRSTEIETSDRITMIVPNSNLVSGVVKNWVRSDRMGRIKITLGFAAPADPDAIRDLLVGCVRENAAVVKLPAPQALLASIDGGALKFELVCFVEDVEVASRIKSDLHFELFRRLKAAGLEPAPAAPAPMPVTVDLTGLDRLIDLLQRERVKNGSEANGADATNENLKNADGAEERP